MWKIYGTTRAKEGENMRDRENAKFVSEGGICMYLYSSADGYSRSLQSEKVGGRETVIYSLFVRDVETRLSGTKHAIEPRASSDIAISSSVSTPSRA